MGGASSLSWYKKGETPALSTPEEEKDVTPGDADIPDSIAKALLDALQEKRTGNNLPPTVIPIARICAAHLAGARGIRSR